MQLSIDKNRPICPQIYELICVEIASGKKTAGDQLYSVRELALMAGVNPNTVQKAFEQLENDGLIYSVVGSGRFVSENGEKAKAIVENIAREKTRLYFQEMHTLGFSDEDIIENFTPKEQ